MHRSAGIYLMAKDNPGKSQLGESLNAMRPISASDGVLYL